ncbi:MAG: radical SAM protein [Victivallales bacterium]
MNRKFTFSSEEVNKAISENRLLTMEIEFSLRCNYKCPYCYISSHGVPENEMTRDEILSVLKQAKKLDVRKIIILGGEPLMYPGIFEMIEYISKLGMFVELFTNGSLVTAETAKKLYAAGVKVVLKLNSFDPLVQEKLTLVDNALPKAMQAFENLRQAGYPDDKAPLAVSSVLTTLNIDEAPRLWRWLRDRNIDPYFEIITPQGRANTGESLMPEREALRRIFFEISEIDAKEYGRHWEPQPPLVGERCMRNRYSCLVTSTGKVFPCVGITESIGDIREKPLAEIITDSEIICNLKNYREMLKGPCASCDKSAECYGCRGSAYQLTGDYLASDPLCWRNENKLDQIDVLPVDAKNLLPHKEPILLVDRLLKQGERSGVVEAVIKKDCVWLGPDEKLLRPACIEMAAQATATLDSFMNRGKVCAGMLIGAREFTTYGDAKVGDTLRIEIFREFVIGEMGIVSAKIFNREQLIAEGELKIWQQKD